MVIAILVIGFMLIIHIYYLQQGWFFCFPPQYVTQQHINDCVVVKDIVMSHGIMVLRL
jgi:hypothetical protein